MNDLAALIQSLGGLAGLATLVTAVGILALQWHNGKKADAAKEAAAAAAAEAKKAADASQAVLVKTADGVFEVGKAIDGRLTALLAAKEAEYAANVKRAYAEGKAAGEQAQRDRTSEPQP